MTCRSIRHRSRNPENVLLAETTVIGVKDKQVTPQELAQVNVDTTVQEKNITHPTNSKLYHTALVKLSNAAKHRSIRLR